jgi:hypothetical protein
MRLVALPNLLHKKWRKQTGKYANILIFTSLYYKTTYYTNYPYKFHTKIVTDLVRNNATYPLGPSGDSKMSSNESFSLLKTCKYFKK